MKLDEAIELAIKVSGDHAGELEYRVQVPVSSDVHIIAYAFELIGFEALAELLAGCVRVKRSPGGSIVHALQS